MGRLLSPQLNSAKQSVTKVTADLYHSVALFSAKLNKGIKTVISY